MRQVLLKEGKAIVEDVPSPQVKKGFVLVRVTHSCISVGTEMSGMKQTALPLWKRALQQPEKAKRALKMMASQGFNVTKNFIQNKMTSAYPTGYSAAGIVEDVGENIDDVFRGERVACGGAQCAFHAEFINVPRNLCVPVPDNLDLKLASSVTVGSIALQGIRRLKPTLGEAFVVSGLGILGQLTVQLLKASGCRVIGIDLDRERVKLALEHGADFGVHPDDVDQIEHVFRLTDGIGADGVIITAATQSDEVISTSFKMCRKKARVVLVGDVGLNLHRWDFYEKELDFLISCSYGPGRYDQNYEEGGNDYPIGYVRWTENRNMDEYLKLLECGKVKIDALIGHTYPIEKASEAYESLKSGAGRSPMVILEYPHNLGKKCSVAINPQTKAKLNGQIRMALVGAGSFAKMIHLPLIKSLKDSFYLQSVMSQSGHNAASTCKQFEAKYSTTDYEHVINDAEVDAVLITTRHNTHGELVLKALKTGKNVLVEKPLTIFENELHDIEKFYANGSSDNKPLLLTGFNRRFSKFAQRIFEIVSNRINPMIINYRMNAGYIALDKWAHGKEGGGRNLGEACHIYDLFTYLTNSKVLDIKVQTILPNTDYYTHRDNFVVAIKFDDGSIANLIYTALGNLDHSKEQMDLYVDGKIIMLDDYRILSIKGAKIKGIENRVIDKGHKEELEAFANAVKNGGDWPIPLWQQIQATKIAFEVEKQLNI